MTTVGFTGTRKGMTPFQKIALEVELFDRNVGEIHHGDCVGADADCHEIAVRCNVSVVLHPATNPLLRAYCRGGNAAYEPKPYLTRNRQIVRAADVLIAAPCEDTEQPRGGTWYTVRFARQRNKPILILWPGGRTTFEPGAGSTSTTEGKREA